jgi:hypothetical protein
MNIREKNFHQSNFRQSILLPISLGMIALLGACSSSNNQTKTGTPTIAITANSGYTAGAAVGTAFGPLAVTVTSNGTPASGVSVTFTAPAAGSSVATGMFATSPAAATDTETTNSSGVATSQTFSAGTVAGSYTVTATTSGATTPASFNLTNNAGSPNSITVYSGTPQSAVISTAYGALAVQVLDSDSNPVAGTQVVFTVNPGGTGASGAFATSGATDTETTDSTGVATTSQTLTANGTVGIFTVTADYSGDTGPATFNLTNVPIPALNAGTYVFSIAGTDSGVSGNGNSPYFAAGAFTLDVNDTITGGEMDFSDYYEFSHDPIRSGNVTISATTGDSNLIITINTGDPNFGAGGNGTLVLDAAMATSSRGALTEYDTWASGVGELDAQGNVSVLCASASSSTPCGYAFVLNGLDSYQVPISVGGVFAIDGAGEISGTGSVFDINDSCLTLNSSSDCVGGTLPSQTVTTSGISPPDVYGFVTISLNSGAFTLTPGIQLDGYMVDANHIRLVEDWTYNGTGNGQDALGATTGGTALAQTGPGGFSSSSISGSSYVISTVGSDSNGVLQVAGVLTFNSDGSMGGTLSFNDGTLIAAQGGVAITGGTYSVDSSGTGRVTVTGLTDTAGDVTYNLELYLTGDGQATVMSMDAAAATNADVQAGTGWVQVSGLTASTPTGNYAYGEGQFISGNEVDGAGTVGINVGTAGTVAGFLDVNYSLDSEPLLSNDPLSATFAATSANGVFTVNGSGSPSHLSTMYLIDATQGVIIESDSKELSLGYFANQ